MAEGEEARVAEAKRLMEAIHSTLMDEFKRYKDVHYNPNTKGADYEKVVADELRDYLSGRFDIEVRAQIIDHELKYLESLPRGGNEIDIVGAFKNASPNIILKIKDTRLVLYDALAFLIEVKKVLDKSNLEADLKKLSKVKDLPLLSSRFGGGFIGGALQVARPLRLLFYVERSIDQDAKMRLLAEYPDSWDAVTILEENNTIVNTSLPFGKLLLDSFTDPSIDKSSKILEWGGNAFMFLMILILLSTPVPLAFNLADAFIKIDTLSKTPG